MTFFNLITLRAGRLFFTAYFFRTNYCNITIFPRNPSRLTLTANPMNPILKCLNFLYKGYIRSPRTKKRYRFSAVKAQVGVRQRFEAVTHFSNVLKAAGW